MASITADEDTQLLTLDQEALGELMNDRPEVARGIIRVLSRRLRDLTGEMDALRSPAPAGEAQAMRVMIPAMA
jgi:CRP-like cAMP-binding protein